VLRLVRQHRTPANLGRDLFVALPGIAPPVRELEPPTNPGRFAAIDR